LWKSAMGTRPGARCSIVSWKPVLRHTRVPIPKVSDLSGALQGLWRPPEEKPMTQTEQAKRILNTFITGAIPYREALERLQRVCGQTKAIRVITTLSTYTLSRREGI
jgi:hypothetical protein